MALMFKEDSMYNKIANHSDYCELCVDKEIKNNTEKLSISEIRKKHTGEMYGIKVLSIKKSGIDYCICPKCAFEFLKENYMDLIINDNEVQQTIKDLTAKDKSAEDAESKKTEDKQNTTTKKPGRKPASK